MRLILGIIFGLLLGGIGAILLAAQSAAAKENAVEPITLDDRVWAPAGGMR